MKDNHDSGEVRLKTMEPERLGGFKIKADDVTFHIQPIDVTKVKMKIVLTIELIGEIDDKGETALRKYTDKIDLYDASQRKNLLRQCVERCFSFHDDFSLEVLLEKVIGEVEKYRDSRLLGKIGKTVGVTTEYFCEQRTKQKTKPKKSWFWRLFSK